MFKDIHTFLEKKQHASLFLSPPQGITTASKIFVHATGPINISLLKSNLADWLLEISFFGFDASSVSGTSTRASYKSIYHYLDVAPDFHVL